MTYIDLRGIMLSEEKASLKRLCTLCDSTDTIFLKLQNCRDGAQVSGCLWREKSQGCGYQGKYAQLQNCSGTRCGGGRTNLNM